MRASRTVAVVGGCVGILGAGWAASPKALPSLDLAGPASPAPQESSAPVVRPSPTCVPHAADDAADAREDEARDAARAAEDAADDAADAREDEARDAAKAAEDAADDAADAREDEARDAAKEDDDCVPVAPAVAAPAPAQAPAQAGATAVDGPVVTNLRGDFQARITVVDGVVTEVQAVVAGTSAAESVAVNARAIPELRARVLAAQTWDVEAVSGASYTSPAFIDSLRGAFGAAGL